MRRQSAERRWPEAKDGSKSKSAHNAAIVELPREEVAAVWRHEAVDFEDDLGVVRERNVADVAMPRLAVDERVHLFTRPGVKRDEPTPGEWLGPHGEEIAQGEIAAREVDDAGSLERRDRVAAAS